LIWATTACIAIEPATVTVDATPALIILDATTSGAGIGISPKKGILKVATVSSDGKVSMVVGRLFGISGGVIGDTSSVDFSLSSSEDKDP